MRSATAFAHTNIALIKYWGKRPGDDDNGRSLNLPATGSLSMTLDAFGAETTVALSDDDVDSFVLDGEEVDAKEVTRVSAFLDLVRAQAKSNARCRVTSRNEVPTAAGLASSASAFAALATAACAAFDLDVDDKTASIFARRGSGSAARSIFGGFVKMNVGTRDDGTDCFAEPVAVHDALDLKLLVVQCATGRKKVGSTVGMNRTAETSPYFQAWVSSHAADLDACERGLRDGDLDVVGAAMEHSTLKMHASALAAQPGLWYWTPTSWSVMERVRDLRDDGGQCYFTMDAGPHVKVLCPSSKADALLRELSDVDGVVHASSSAVGQGARVTKVVDG